MSGVLVLDATYQPERIVSFRAACELLLEGKAVAATEDAVTVMRSPSISVTIPSVILLLHVARWAYRHEAPACTRHGVLHRDSHECQFVIGDNPCRRRADSIDHLLPQCRGGENTWTNLVASCTHHNGLKADRTLDEMVTAGWSLRRSPVAPRRSVRMLQAAGVHRIPDSWTMFIAA
ncbi:MAG TPA: HNH endonuclease [Ilumatobacteraceae bacterium]